MTLFDPKNRVVEGTNFFGKPKTPPGQVSTAKFPVLTYGSTPIIDIKDWRFRVWGEVEEEIQWTWDDFMNFPQTTLHADFHCVTHWSRFDDDWTGVLFKDLITYINVKPTARFVMQHAYGGYTTNNSLEVMLNEDVIFAHTFNGRPLPREHGGPMRVFTPRRYAWKGAKWVNGIEFMPKDRPGFWELNGYNTPADPWKEERYG
ncbi:MAG: sulfite oxidase-like oxidoreductase [Ignavibacteria bacterium]|nr:sulfite oxidase-like oxidoreductase [Ignavibacteria bacterium]MBI3765338.1 sulfite oxidase-like oxidoreductase [Ignavibacteriales bacterium]